MSLESEQHAVGEMIRIRDEYNKMIPKGVKITTRNVDDLKFITAEPASQSVTDQVAFYTEERLAQLKQVVASLR